MLIESRAFGSNFTAERFRMRNNLFSLRQLCFPNVEWGSHKAEMWRATIERIGA
jgi:hypothetical protein